MNDLEVKEEEPLYLKFFEQFKNPLIYLLLGSAFISLLTGELDNAVSITLAIIIVVTVAFVQEYRSEKSLEALNKLVPHYCHVLRDGSKLDILANELVPGDVIQFSTGDRIPADIRITAATELQIDESNLTGENKPVKKFVEKIQSTNAEVPLTDRKNIGFMGTLVRHGHGVGVVVGIGEQTEFGAVFHMMKEVETKKTPLQLKMDTLGKQLSIMSFVVIAFIVLVGVMQGRKLLEMFTIGVSLAVAAIPEGLPIVVTVTLALGVLRMADRKVIIKKLPSVETLSSVNVICVDKTGTLTRNQMTVKNIYTVDQSTSISIEQFISSNIKTKPPSQFLLRIANLCNNAYVDNSGNFHGQATEVALLDLLHRLNVPDGRPMYEKISEEPFNSEKKLMSVICRPKNSESTSPSKSPLRQSEITVSSKATGAQAGCTYVKGALEQVLRMSHWMYLSESDVRPLTESDKNDIIMRARELSAKGLRVLGFGFGADPHSLRFVGFVGMHDPPRPGMADAIQHLIEGGVKVAMITGDSEGTAISIARELGIPVSSTTTSCMSGFEIDSIPERQLQERISSISVFYRTTPRHKMTIVKAFQSVTNSVVAMTGDGVNDAPALRLANIGISMGASGTDVSKEAADMILVNDDFSTVLRAIEEGKSIFYNIRNFLRFQLSTSVSALSLISLSTLLGYPNPLNAMQILWINIIMDGPQAQSLGVEPVDHDVMKEPPRPKDAPILTRQILGCILTSAPVMVLGTLYVYRKEMAEDNMVTPRVTTMTFTTFVFFDLFNALACRSTTKSVVEVGLLKNRTFAFAASFSFITQLMLIYIPFLQRIFQTVPLKFTDLIEIVCITSMVLWVDEIRKWLQRGNRVSYVNVRLGRVEFKMPVVRLFQKRSKRYTALNSV